MCPNKDISIQYIVITVDKLTIPSKIAGGPVPIAIKAIYSLSLMSLASRQDTLFNR